MCPTALAFVVAAVLALVGGMVGNALGFGSRASPAWPWSAGLLATLVDREGFYGVPRR